MLIISHRGNLNGTEKENTNEQIEKAINAGFYVEVDVWGIDLRLGHDTPGEKCKHNDKLIYHCKDLAAAVACRNNGYHFFMHDTDKRVLTSYGYFWTFPSQPICHLSIACLPELFYEWDIKEAAGICTDYPIKYNDLTTNG